MRDPSSLEALERIYGLLARSFLRYMVEAAGPGVRDEWDRRALAAFQAWHDDLMQSLIRMENLLEEEKVYPDAPPWPLDFSLYHMVSAAYLLGPVAKRMEAFHDRVEEEAEELGGWPEAQAAVRGCLERNSSHLQAVRALEAEIPHLPPKPAVKKGVSANFW